MGAASDALDPTVVYIAGYGRSGSTLLDMILDCHPDVVGTGELSFLFDEVRAGIPCTCGESLLVCPLWGPVLDRVRERGFTWQEAASITRTAERAPSRQQDAGAYGRLWGEVTAALHEHTGASIIVDSSKSARWTVHRTRLLRRHTPDAVRTIHLVRHPVGVMESVHHGSNQALEAGIPGNTRLAVIRAMVGWLMANALVECAHRRSPTETLLVRYEDLVGDPETTLRRVGTFIGCDLSVVTSPVLDGEIPGGHGIGGNRMRRSPGVRLQRSATAVATDAPPAPSYIRRLAVLLWPLSRTYGYG